MSAETGKADPITRFQFYRLALAYRVVSALIVVLVLLQAVLVGRGWFLGEGNLVKIHGNLGSLTFLAAVALGAIALALRPSARHWLRFLAPIAILIILVAAQLGLGYSGRKNSDAAALHIPNGVLIFGLSVLILVAPLPRSNRR